MAIFINNAITNGINNYILSKNNKQVDSTHFFELRIIEVLVNIYNEVDILNPYKSNNYRAFKDNLTKYGLSNLDANNFINYLNDYDTWLNNSSGDKDATFNELILIVLKMILLKKAEVEISSLEYEFYENFLFPKDNKLDRIFTLASPNREYIKRMCDRKKVYFKKDKYILKEIEPELLSQATYANYGLDISDVKKLSNMKINEVNKIIKSEDKEGSSSGGRRKILELKISSGSGFVDTIVLLSIMMTEIMIGFIIAISIARM